MVKYTQRIRVNLAVAKIWCPKFFWKCQYISIHSICTMTISETAELDLLDLLYQIDFQSQKYYHHNIWRKIGEKFWLKLATKTSKVILKPLVTIKAIIVTMKMFQKLSLIQYGYLSAKFNFRITYWQRR